MYLVVNDLVSSKSVCPVTLLSVLLGCNEVSLLALECDLLSTVSDSTVHVYPIHDGHFEVGKPFKSEFLASTSI